MASPVNGISVYTMSCWAKLDSQSSGEVFGGYRFSLTSSASISVSGQDRLRLFAISDGQSVVSRTFLDPYAASTWYHCCAVLKQNGFDLYLDGSFVASSVGPAYTGGSDNWSIGKGLAGNGALGLVDDARVYHRELTQAEITHLASSRGVLGPPGGAAANYNPFRNAKYINKTYQIPRFG